MIYTIGSNKQLTIVDMCRMYTSLKLLIRSSPPNITALSSSIIVREKAAQGGGLDPFKDGDDQEPKEGETEDIELITAMTLL